MQLMLLMMTSASDDDDDEADEGSDYVGVAAYEGDDVNLHCFARVRAAIWHFGKIMLPCGEVYIHMCVYESRCITV